MLRFYEENDIEKMTEMSRRDYRNCKDMEHETKYIIKKEYCPPVVYVQCPSAVQEMANRYCSTTPVCDPCKPVVNTCKCNTCDPCGNVINTPSCKSCDPCGSVINTPSCKSCDPCGSVINTSTSCNPCTSVTTCTTCEPTTCVPYRKPTAATFVSKNLAAVSLLGNLATLPMNNILGGATPCTEGLVLDPISGTIRVCQDGLYQIDFSAKLTFAIGAGVSLVVNGEEVLPIRAIFEVGELGGNVVLYLKAGDTVKLALTGLLSVDIKITGIAGVLTIIKID